MGIQSKIRMRKQSTTISQKPEFENRSQRYAVQLHRWTTIVFKKIEGWLDKDLPNVPIVNYFGVQSMKTIVQLK